MYFFCDILIFIFVTLFLISFFWYFYVLMMVKSWPKQSTLLYDFKYIDFCLKCKIYSRRKLQYASTCFYHSSYSLYQARWNKSYNRNTCWSMRCEQTSSWLYSFFFTFNLLIFNLILQCLIWFLTRAQAPRVRHIRRRMSWRIRKSRIIPEMTPPFAGRY